ncbi:hypothetical protein GCM10022276_20590 [Sphingomonas limnosediminicola]|jgi:hypothetical protein|uniref:PilZ domain-containing protein n=1 Tax=Sphingomonas limnosediminicola TaxID=940133 RepID=A0ABP7LL37_9SPHN
MDWSNQFEKQAEADSSEGAAPDRRSHRAPVLLAGTVEVLRRRKQVKIRNFSEDGALIEGDCLPKEGTMTRFERNDLKLSAQVVWVQGRYAGLKFERPLGPEEVLRYVPAPRAKMESSYKRPGLACRPLSSYERKMIESWMVTAPMVPD